MNASGKEPSGQCTSNGGGGRAARDHGRGAFEPRHQCRQFRLHFEHHLGAVRGQERHVARELDGVAKSLLGVQEHGFARQRIIAEPQRPAAALLLGHAAAAPAPFVFIKAAAIVAEREQCQRFHEMGVGVVLAQRMRLAVAGDRIVEAVERGQRPAAIEQRAGMIGRRGKRAVVGRDRIGVAAEIVQRDAAVEMRGRMARHQGQSMIELGDRLVERAKRGVRDAAVEPRFRVLRHPRQNLAERGERFLGAAQNSTARWRDW